MKSPKLTRFSTLAIAALMGAGAGNVQAAGNAELGKTKAMYCVSCHGVEGKQELPMFTGGVAKLAGMDQQKFVNAMKAYRYGQRFHPMMQFFVMPINEQDMSDLAAYYANLGPSLYERLGGKDAINAVVKDLLAGNMADSRLKPRMSTMDAARCERQLTDLLCQATGGPCKYNGRDMKTAHTGAKVTETEWQAFTENLSKTFDRFNVPSRERSDLVQLLIPMKGDIVGR
jgi:hemoglobin